MTGVTNIIFNVSLENKWQTNSSLMTYLLFKRAKQKF
jgi:hypothetical protein